MDAEQVKSIAQALQETPVIEETLDAAKTLVAQQQGDALLHEILVQKGKNSARHVAVADTMALLEWIVEDHPQLGEYLMLRLYPIALLAYRHDVADAIGLWISSRGGPELAEMIQRISLIEEDETVRQEYAEWAGAMLKAQDNN